MGKRKMERQTLKEGVWQRSDIWRWFLSESVPKEKSGRGKSAVSKYEDERNIRMRAIINGDRLIVGVWRGAAGERCGVYYMTSGASTNVCLDGVNWHSGKLEHVPLGGYTYWGYTYNYKYSFVSGEREALEWLCANFSDTVRRYCNYDAQDYISAIESNVIYKRRINGIKRKRERINTWLSELPPLPGDIDSFIDNTVFCGLHYAFGDKDKDEYTCSACAKEFTFKDMKHGKAYECPMCGAAVRCEKKRYPISLCDRITLIQSFHDQRGYICSIERVMYVRKDFLVTGEEKGISNAAVFVLPLKDNANGVECYYYSNEWSDKNTWGFKHAASYCYPDVLALEGTAYDRRAVEAAARQEWRLNYNNLLWWYYNEPRMEYLIKGGFYGLVKDLTTDYSSAHLMEGKDIKSVLGLDGQGVARLRQAGGGVAYLDWLRKAFMCGFKIPEKTIRYFIKNKIYPHEVEEEIKQGASPEQIANYIEKQRKMCNSSADYIVTTWRDTLNMQGQYKLGGGSYTLFPKNLKRRHAELCGIRDIELHKKELAQRLDGLDSHISSISKEVRQIEEKYPNVADICESVKKIFEWGDLRYLVKVPTCAQDVLIEGYLLGHCIARPKSDGSYLYFERIESRESYICFLRKFDSPNSPWYTMEVEPDGSIRQLRTFGDDEGADREEAKAFLKKWRREVKRRLGKADIEAADVSREKRLAEFAQLRRDKNRIYGGKLQGLLLADVLEADFKEFNETDAESA